MHRYSIHRSPLLPHWGFRKLKGLYATAVLRNFGGSLAGIFIPLYIFETFGHLGISGATLKVVSYFFVLEFASLLSTLPAIRISLKIGWKKAVFLGNFLAAMKLLLLIFAKNNHFWFLPSAILWGISIPLYWNFYHLVFVEKSEDSYRGEQISLVGILERLIGVIGPFLGGLIISFFGFKYLLTLSLFFITFSSLPMSFTNLNHFHSVPSFKKLVQKLFVPSTRRTFLAIGAIGAQDLIALIAWPIFVFFILQKNFVSLGAITSFSLFLSVLVLFLVGRLTDKKGKRKVLTLGVITGTLIWVVKGLVGSVYQVIIIDVLDKFTYSFIWVPFTTIVYKLADQSSDRLEFIALREMALKIGNIVGLCSLGIFLYFGASWFLIFLLAAFWTLSSLVIVTKKRY